MQVIQSSEALKRSVRILKNKKKSIGFVPTMGYLHQGHLDLVKRSVAQNDVTIVSIFVNPLQFGPHEDFKRYPRDAARDQKLLRSAGADLLFFPDVKNFYSSDFQTTVSVGRLSKPLCGGRRPGHFEGVATVVLKLLNLVSPDVLYLGQKDFQQCRVVEQMVEDMGVPVAVRRVPIFREKDGLAMSSRNVYLSPPERSEAVILSRSLARAQDFIRSGERSAAKIKKEVLKTLKAAKRGRVDYAEIVDARTLRSVVRLKKGMKVLVALAVFFSKTRLIDNALVEVA